jgi:hypothetical protein
MVQVVELLPSKCETLSSILVLEENPTNAENVNN